MSLATFHEVQPPTWPKLFFPHDSWTSSENPPSRSQVGLVLAGASTLSHTNASLSLKLGTGSRKSKDPCVIPWLSLFSTLKDYIKVFVVWRNKLEFEFFGKFWSIIKKTALDHTYESNKKLYNANICEIWYERDLWVFGWAYLVQ